MTKTTRVGLVLLCGAFFATPAQAQAALTQAQVDSVLGLLAAFGADQSTINNVRATLGGASAPATGSLWFGGGAPVTETPATRGSARVPLTTLTLANNTESPVTVYSLVVERVGSSKDSAVNSVTVATSAGDALATSYTLDSRHQATLLPNLVIPPRQSVALTLTATIARTARTGKTIGFSVVAVNASSPVSGSLPIAGTLQKVK